ncbi:lexA repressor [bacterium BMS3Abin03]|nr:lexA repressor [bacterium BMS3Abin03]
MIKHKYTFKQGQYLAFIYYYTKINGRPPSESNIQNYFKVTWPSVHRMVITLEQRELIKRTPGKARSIQLLISTDELPKLK